MKSQFTIKAELGFVLMLIGVQLGTAIRNVFHIELVNLLMVLSFLFVIDYRNLSRLRFPSWNKGFKWIIIFDIVEFIYLIFNFGTISEFLQYHLYLLFIIIAISTQTKDLHINRLSIFLFITTAFISITVGYQATQGFSGIYTENVFYNETTNSSGLAEGGDKITMGRALLLCIISCIVFFFKGKYFPIICSGLIAVSFIGLFMFGTRASMACAFLCLFLYIGKKYGFNIFASQKLKLSFVFILFFLGIIYSSTSYVQESLDTYTEGLLRGVFTMFGSNEYGTDASTITRYYTMQKAFSFWNAENFSIITMVVGHGYFPFYIDVPVIQAFYDFGCWGFLYFFIMVLLPIRYIMKRTDNDAIIIIQLFAVQYLLDQFYCALPYYHFQFMPLILLLFFYSNNRKNYYKAKTFG